MNQIVPAGRLQALIGEAARLISRRAAGEALPLLRAAALTPGAPAEVFGLLAEAQVQRGDGEAALIAAETALATDSADPRLRLLRAQARRLCRDQLGALDDAAFAVMHLPGDGLARTVLATCLSEHGRHDEALFLFWQLAGEAPSDARSLVHLALALSRAGRREAAEEVYDLASRSAAEFNGLAAPRVQNMLALGDASRALALAEEGLEREGPSGALEAARGQALLSSGRREEAGAALDLATRLAPSDSFVAHLATALAGASGQASEAYTRELFDHYADNFEASLFALGYRAPGLILRALEAVRPGLAECRTRLGDVLDLGCGTGLGGVVVHDLMAGRLVGVDLSPRMIAAARAKAIYTSLVEGEIGAFLAACSAHFDVIMAADVFVYLGDLRPVLRDAARCLAPGGHLAFTCEAGADGFAVTPQGRFRHGEAHLRAALSEAGLAPLILRPEALRMEGGQPVEGWLVLATGDA